MTETYYRVRTIFSVENSRCFQGIFKDKFKNFKVNVTEHEINNFDQNITTIRERLRDFFFFEAWKKFYEQSTDLHKTDKNERNVG